MRPGWPARLKEWALSLLFPNRCLLCGGLVPAGKLFCSACQEKGREAPVCREIRLPEGGRMRVVSAFRYEDGYRENLHQYKFYGQRALAKPLGRLMARAVRAEGLDLHCVAYAPMSLLGLLGRGYDQSYLLAQAVAGELGLPMEDVLAKARRTRTQHELGREARMVNVRGAYRAVRNLDGKNVLLIDDIVTTGSTLAECAQALYDAGAGLVCGLCAADAGRANHATGKESD